MCLFFGLSLSYFISRLTFFFFFNIQGKTIHNNPALGTLVSNQSLVLQRVTRMQAGLYTCVGSNQEGDGESSPLYLDVKCKFTFFYPLFYLILLLFFRLLFLSTSRFLQMETVPTWPFLTMAISHSVNNENGEWK